MATELADESFAGTFVTNVSGAVLTLNSSCENFFSRSFGLFLGAIPT